MADQYVKCDTLRATLRDIYVEENKKIYQIHKKGGASWDSVKDCLVNGKIPRLHTFLDVCEGMGLSLTMLEVRCLGKKTYEVDEKFLPLYLEANEEKRVLIFSLFSYLDSWILNNHDKLRG